MATSSYCRDTGAGSLGCTHVRLPRNEIQIDIEAERRGHSLEGFKADIRVW